MSGAAWNGRESRLATSHLQADQASCIERKQAAGTTTFGLRAYVLSQTSPSISQPAGDSCVLTRLCVRIYMIFHYILSLLLTLSLPCSIFIRCVYFVDPRVDGSLLLFFLLLSFSVVSSPEIFEVPALLGLATSIAVDTAVAILLVP
ncbi:hypothetical protein F5X96DRAFT_101686 [Biscogniauxia mediterranea]|nr:hypothetical protein F5X96DRAFT_101686 [Biscogniauxia mediterranea]